MKKILAMVLSVALIASLAIGGTVAYLTDSDEATNVFAVGNVEIELLEEQRDWSIGSDGLVDKTTTLEKFEQNKNLMPIVTEDVNEDGSGKFAYDTLGMNTAQNYQDKIVRVKNTGSSEAWVRIFVAVPAALEDKDEDGNATNKTVLHWDVGERFDKDNGSKYNSSTEDNPFTSEFEKADFVSKQTIANTEYNIYSFTRKMPLKAGETTAAAFVGFYLDEEVDNNSDDGYYYIGSKKDKNNRITVKGVGAKKGGGSDYEAAYDFSNGVVIPVYAEAVQTSGFATAEDAFSRAIGSGTEEKPYNPWTAGNATVELPGAVKDVNELRTALNELKNVTGTQTITLCPNMVYDFSGQSAQFYNSNRNATIIIEGNGAVITGLTEPLFNSIQCKSITIKDLTISGLNLADSVGGAYIGAFIQYTTYGTKNITLSNCHLKNSTVSTTKTGTHIGGLIGGAYVDNDMKNTVTIENCSVINCNLSGSQNVGGLMGWQAYGTPTITNVEVKNCNITSKNTEKWLVGTIVGTNDSSTITVTGYRGSDNNLMEANFTGDVPVFTDTNYRNTVGSRGLYGHINVNNTTIF